MLPRLDVSGGIPVVKVADFQMLEPRWMAAAVAKGDFIYIIGGLDEHRNRLTSIERFNVRTGKSEPFAELLVGRRAHRAVLVGDKIYVLGGLVGTITSASGNLAPSLATNPLMNASNKAMPELGRNFDPDSDYLVREQFRKLEARTGAAKNAADMSGAPEDVARTTEIIDLATHTVSPGPDMPEARSSFAAVLRSGKIYVIGGQRPYKNSGRRAVTNTAWVFDVATNQWSPGVPMPTPRDNMDGVLVDGGVIVVAGGYDGQNQHAEVEVFNPADGIWRTLPSLGRGVSAASPVFFNHYLLLFGDYSSPGELISYNLVNRQSDTFTLNYKPARHAAAVALDGKIFVIGGMADSAGTAFDYIQVYAAPQKAK